MHHLLQNIDCITEEYVKEGETEKSYQINGLEIYWYKQFIKGNYPAFLANPEEDDVLTRDILTIQTTKFIWHLVDAIAHCRLRYNVRQFSAIINEKRRDSRIT